MPPELSKPHVHLAVRGLIATKATVGNSSWQTSLLPMGDGTHFIALPATVRSKENLPLGAKVEVSFEPRTGNGKQRMATAWNTQESAYFYSILTT